LDIADHQTVGRRHQHDLVFGVIGRHDVLDPGIVPPGFGIDSVEQRDPIAGGDFNIGPVMGIEIACEGGAVGDRNRCRSLGAIGDIPRRIGGNVQIFGGQFVGIGKACFLTGGCPDADALPDTLRGPLDDPLFHGDRLGLAILKIQVRIVDGRDLDPSQRLLDFSIGYPETRQCAGLVIGHACAPLVRCVSITHSFPEAQCKHARTICKYSEIGKYCLTFLDPTARLALLPREST